MIRKSDPVTVI